MGVFDRLPGFGGESSEPPDPEPEAEDAAAGAKPSDPATLEPADFRERAEALAGRSDVPTLDYTVESLGDLDRMATGTHPVDDALTYGSYLGETLVAQFDGEWVREDGWIVAMYSLDDRTTVAVFDAAEMALSSGPIFEQVAERLEQGGFDESVPAQQTTEDSATDEGTDEAPDDGSEEPTPETDEADDDTTTDVSDEDRTDEPTDSEPAEPTDDALDGSDAPADVATDEPVDPTPAVRRVDGPDPEHVQRDQSSTAEDADVDADAEDVAAAGAAEAEPVDPTPAVRRVDGPDSDHVQRDRTGTGDDPAIGEAAGDVGEEIEDEPTPGTAGDDESAAPADVVTDEPVDPTPAVRRVDGPDPDHIQRDQLAAPGGTDEPTADPPYDDGDAPSTDVDATAAASDSATPDEAAESADEETPEVDTDVTTEADTDVAAAAIDADAVAEVPVDEGGDVAATDTEAEPPADEDADEPPDVEEVEDPREVVRRIEAEQGTVSSTDGAEEVAPSEAIPPQSAFRTAAEGFAGRWDDRNFDFSPTSLSRLDAFVASQWDGRFREGSFADVSRDPREGDGPLVQVASYYGEVLVRALGGSWTATEAGEPGVEVTGRGEQREVVDVFDVTRACLIDRSTLAYQCDALANRLDIDVDASDALRSVFSVDVAAPDAPTNAEAITTILDRADAVPELWPTRQLDFSPTSLDRLDGAVDRAFDADRFAGVSLHTKTDAEALRLTDHASMLGAYFAAVLVRHCNAQWQIDERVTLLVEGPEAEEVVDPVRVAAAVLQGEDTFGNQYATIRRETGLDG